MKYSFLYKYIVLIIIVISSLSCSKKKSFDEFSGVWSVEDSGIQGLEITYRFSNDTIFVDTNIDKVLADSLGENKFRRSILTYIVKSDSLSFYFLDVTEPVTGTKGEYRIALDKDKMTIKDNNGEIFNLNKSQK